MTRRLFILEEKEDIVAEETESWSEEYTARWRCPECREWLAEVTPEPVELELAKPYPGVLNAFGYFGITTNALASIFEKYWGTGVLVGRVFLESGQRIERLRTFCAPTRLYLEIDRGRYSRHEQCSVCSGVKGMIAWAYPATLERYLDNRLCYLTRSGEVIVDQRVLEFEDLLVKFPMLRIIELPVLAEPLDGEIIPGDPGWTGKLDRRPKPIPPTRRPERGTSWWK